MKILYTCGNSIFAGLMIAIGAIIYLNCPNRIVGAFLFSIGLITIMELDFNLYTGRVGYVRKLKDVPSLALTFLMNAAGCTFAMLIPTEGATLLWESKLETAWYVVFAKAIICGILIYVCVHQHKRHQRAVSRTVSIITTLVAIPAFILCGAEHSIADICFMLAANNFTMKGVVFILIVAAGNAVGSLSVSVWIDYRHELHKDNKK